MKPTPGPPSPSGDDGSNSILVVRMHAIGDVAITLSACAALKQQYPDVRIDYVTTSSTAPLAQSLHLFQNIIVFPDCTTRRERLASVYRMRKALQGRTYRTVLDLQNNWVSRSILQILTPITSARFDRVSPVPAGQRVYQTFRAGGFPNLAIHYSLPVRRELINLAREKLRNHGWNPERKLIVLNPAGLWESRNWPVGYYTELGRMIAQGRNLQLLFLGTERIRRKADLISSGLRSSPIDLIDKTSLEEILPLLSLVSLVLSEDSGLMHMAWTLGIPTVALLGSSRHDWSVPMGAHTRAFHSGDLSCGSCMQIRCPYGDTFCLGRLAPYVVHDAVETLLAQHGSCN